MHIIRIDDLYHFDDDICTKGGGVCSQHIILGKQGIRTGKAKITLGHFILKISFLKENDHVQEMGFINVRCLHTGSGQC